MYSSLTVPRKAALRTRVKTASVCVACAQLLIADTNKFDDSANSLIV